jgi:O-antigen/teichoic acid export membrane protein
MERQQRRPLTLLTVRGLFWNYLSMAVAKAGGLIVTIVAARILTPAEFGLVAYSVVAVDLLGLVKDMGLGAALIQSRSDDPDVLDTAYTLNLIVGILLTAVAGAASPQLASWVNEPEVENLIRFLGLSFLFDSLGAVHLVLLRRNMDFQRKLGVDVVRASAKLVVALVGVLTGFGVWALVASTVVGTVVGSAAARVFYPWTPRLRVDAARARELLQYGGRLTAAHSLTIIQGRAELLIVAAWFGSSALGLYSVADKAPSLLAGNLLWVTTGVLFPAYASIQHESERLSSALLDTVRFSSMLYVPLALGLCLTADLLVRGVLGAQWAPAIGILRILALCALVSTLAFNLSDFLNSVGRTDLMLKLAALDLAIFVPVAMLGAVAAGPAGVAVGRLLATTATSAVRGAISLKIAGIPTFSFLRALTPAVAAGTVLAVVVLATLQLPLARPFPHLALAVVIGATVYGATLWRVDRDSIRDLTKRISPARDSRLDRASRLGYGG